MTDITETHIEAAIIDQKAAMMFHDRRYAFTTVITERGWQLAVAVKDEVGYHPCEGKLFGDADEARRWADGLNEHIGLTEERVLQIVISSMRRDGRRS